MYNLIRAAALASAVIATGAFAQGEDLTTNDWAFNLFNDSSYTISSFAVFEPEGYWGENWLRSSLRPGIGLTMDWPNRTDDRCVVPVEVVFTDGAVFTADVDFCGTAALYVDDVGITY